MLHHLDLACGGALGFYKLPDDSYNVSYHERCFDGFWSTGSPNNLGHNDFPGCFRCHDSSHTGSDGQTISNDCSACHNLLAVQEESPKVLTDLGVQ